MSASGDWGPAPPGIDLSEHQSGSIISTVTAVMTLAVVAVVLRLVARFKARNVLAADDYLIFLALLFAIGTAMLCFLSIPNGGGKHLWGVTFAEFTRLWQLAYAFVLIYATGVTLTKASILLFYRRLFGTNWAFHVCLGLVVGYWIACIVAWLAGCRPASYFWEQFTKPNAEGSCIDTSLFYFINGICAMLIDIFILLVPIPTIIHLHMPLPQKIAVSGILLLGAFVCIASILRIIAMDALVKAEDFTWAMGEVFIWSCCEPLIGIVCACLPTYGPLFRTWWKKINSTGSRSKKSTGLSGGGNRGMDLENTNVRMNLAKREFRRLHDGPDKLRGDEVELTNEILGLRGSGTQTEGSDDGVDGVSEGIRVRKDVSWISVPKRP